MNPASLRPIPLAPDDSAIARLCLLVDENNQPAHARHRPGEIACLGAITDQSLRIREYLTIVAPPPRSVAPEHPWASPAKPHAPDRWPVPEALRAGPIPPEEPTGSPLPRGITRIEPFAPISLDSYIDALASEATDRLRDDIAATLAEWSCPITAGFVPTYTSAMPAAARAPESLQLACLLLRDVLRQIEQGTTPSIPLRAGDIGIAPTRGGLMPTLWSVEPVLPVAPTDWILTIPGEGTTWVRSPEHDATLSVTVEHGMSATARSGSDTLAYTVALPEPLLLLPVEHGARRAIPLSDTPPTPGSFDRADGTAWMPHTNRTAASAVGALIQDTLDRLAPALARAVADELAAARDLAAGLRDGEITPERARAGLGAIAQRCGWTWVADPVSCAQLRDVLTGLLEERG